MGSCQNYGPFWGTLNIRCRIIIRTQNGNIILTTTHMDLGWLVMGFALPVIKGMGIMMFQLSSFYCNMKQHPTSSPYLPVWPNTSPIQAQLEG